MVETVEVRRLNVGPLLRDYVTFVRVTWSWREILNVLVLTALILLVLFGIVPTARKFWTLERTPISESVQTRRPPPRVATPADDYRAFMRSFPPERLVLTLTDQLRKSVEKSGLSLISADYRPSLDPSGLRRYEASLAMRGDYASIKKFVSSSLTEIPTASLDGLIMSRNSSADALVDAQMKLSIYMAAE